MVDRAARTLDPGASPIVRLLLRVRGMRADALRPDSIEQSGFCTLADEPGREIVLGLVGRFWRIGGGLCRIEPDDFIGFDQPGWAKAAWNFHLTPLPDGGTLLETETRVRCTDVRSRRRFGAYWLIVRPFSGLIRRLVLRQIRRVAEAG